MDFQGGLANMGGIHDLEVQQDNEKKQYYTPVAWSGP